MSWPILCVASALLLHLCDRFEAVQVTIKQGTLEGILSTSRNGSEFFSFYKIPFAKPPLGEFRFQPPKEPDNWEGIREAKTPPPICIQSLPILFPFNPAGNDVIGEEDCLYLNVFTPNVTPSTLLPVMVYIHGGAFYWGGSYEHGPEYFMDHPIIVVTIQYRLGILGFLSKADEILPGNYGMKDQTAALKWVQHNIGAFGGDSKRVSIVGESAGGGSVGLHLYSPLSKGLFHGAICQSGCALAPWALFSTKTAKNRAEAVGVLSGCADVDSEALVKCLRKIPAQQLVSTHNKFFIYDCTPPVLFGPVIEPKSVHDAFLTENPWRQQVISDVPLMSGVTADDGNIMVLRIRALQMLIDEWTRDYERLLPIALFYFDKTDPKTVSATTAAIKNFYFGNEDISLKTRNNLKEMFTDGYFAITCLEAVQRVNSTTYFYLYDHQNEHTWGEMGTNVTDDLGVNHVDDLISLFNLNGVFPPITKSSTNDYAVSERMVKYWVNFVTNGDPNGERKIWHPFRSDNFAYLHIKTESDVMEEKFRYKNYVFWKDSVFPILSSDY